MFPFAFRKSAIIRLVSISQFLFIFASYITASCSRTSNALDELRLECGPDMPLNSDDLLILKVTNPSTVKDLDSGQFSVSYAGSENEMPDVSTKGCVQVDRKAGELRIRSSHNGETIGTSVAVAELSPGRINRKLLQFSPKIQADFSCPNEGVYARDVFHAPLALEVKGDATNLGIQILAKSLSSGNTQILKTKLFGSKLNLLDEEISISHLEEGTFELSIAEYTLENGLKDSYKITPTRNTCLLTKLPKIVDPKHADDILLRRTDEVLLEAPEQLRLNYCKAHLNSFSAEEKTSKTCSLPQTCLGDENFKEALLLKADEEGVFRYFYFHTNRSNEKSKMACMDVLVSASAPKVGIQWTDARLSLSPTSVDLPYSHLELSITSGHKFSSHTELKMTQQCYATIATTPSFATPGKAIICASEECKGMSMDKPVPCGDNLKIDLTTFYEVPEFWDSKLSIHVIADDGLGNKSEAATSLWFHSSMWGIFHDSKDNLESVLTGATRLNGNLYFYQLQGEPIYIDGKVKSGDNALPAVLAYEKGMPRVLSSPKTESSVFKSISKMPNGDSLILWGKSEGCMLVRYSDDEVTTEIPLAIDGINCDDSTIKIGEDGSIWIQERTWKPRIYRVASDSLPFRQWDIQTLDCYPQLVPVSAEKFLLECDSEIYSMVGDFLTKEVNAEGLKIPRDNYSMSIRVNDDLDTTFKCQDGNIQFFSEGNAVYFPMMRLFEKAGIPWTPELACITLTRTGDSIIYDGGNFVLRFGISRKRFIKTAHLPTEGGKLFVPFACKDHLLFVNQALTEWYVFKNYSFMNIDVPWKISEQDMAISEMFLNADQDLVVQFGEKVWLLEECQIFSETTDPSKIIRSNEELGFPANWEFDLLQLHYILPAI